jgi:hypothetical protein
MEEGSKRNGGKEKNRKESNKCTATKKLVKKDEVDKGRGRKECRTENTERKKKAT